jgi:hydroxymethylpyrimidine pyrophosphatase-like HAD family hydrolase
MEIFPSYAGKGAAVDKMLSLLDIKRENSYAAGDEENDISMLESAGCGIAPANATEKVKAAADVVLSLDNDHDAFAQILLREAYA